MSTNMHWRAQVVRWYGLFDAIKPGWLRYACCVAIGIVAAALLGLADTRGDWLKVCLALAGFMVAFMSSRLLDAYADRRRIDRKIKVALMRLHSATVVWRMLRDEVNGAMEKRGGELDQDYLTENLDVADQMFVRASQVHKALATMPDLDDLIETEEDLRLVAQIQSVFQSTLGATAAEELAGINPRVKGILASAYASSSIRYLTETTLEVLERAQRHFWARVNAP